MISDNPKIIAVVAIAIVFAALLFFLPIRRVGIAMITGRKIISERSPSNSYRAPMTKIM